MATIKRLNPPELPVNPAFSQGVSVEGPARMVYIGGQYAVAADGTVVGDDVRAQTEVALQNLEHVLAAVGAQLENVVSWTILLVEGQPLPDAFRGLPASMGRAA